MVDNNTITPIARDFEICQRVRPIPKLGGMRSGPLSKPKKVADLPRNIMHPNSLTLARPLVAVYGASGAGKSSILNVGVPMTRAFRRQTYGRASHARGVLVDPRPIPGPGHS